MVNHEHLAGLGALRVAVRLSRAEQNNAVLGRGLIWGLFWAVGGTKQHVSKQSFRLRLCRLGQGK